MGSALFLPHKKKMLEDHDWEPSPTSPADKSYKLHKLPAGTHQTTHDFFSWAYLPKCFKPLQPQPSWMPREFKHCIAKFKIPAGTTVTHNTNGGIHALSMKMESVQPIYGFAADCSTGTLDLPKTYSVGKEISHQDNFHCFSAIQKVYDHASEMRLKEANAF